MYFWMRNTDIDALSKGWLENGAKYQDVTMYWSGIKTFIPISFLDPPLNGEPSVTMYPDSIHVYKTYLRPPEPENNLGTLENWKRVWVIVTIENVWDKRLKDIIFGDVIQWPWNLHFDENEVFEWIQILGFETGSKLREDRNEYLYKYYFDYNCPWGDLGMRYWGVKILKKDWQFAYYLTVWYLDPWDTLRIWYELEYADMKVKDMSLNYDEYWNNDIYPDIKLQSVDGCDKNFLAFINSWTSRTFNAKNINLQSEIEKSYTETMRNTDDYSNEVSNIGSNVNALPGIVWY